MNNQPSAYGTPAQMRRAVQQKADAGARAQADALDRARPARDAMKLPNLSEREVCSLIQGLQHVIANCGWSHTQAAMDAQEYLTSAHAVLEDQAEVHA